MDTVNELKLISVIDFTVIKAVNYLLMGSVNLFSWWFSLYRRCSQFGITSVQN